MSSSAIPSKTTGIREFAGFVLANDQFFISPLPSYMNMRPAILSAVSQMDTRPKKHWIEDVYKHNAAGETAHGIDLIFQHVNSHLQRDEIPACDSLLLTADLKRMNSSLIVALLSISKPVSQKLSNWEGFLARAESALKGFVPDRCDHLMKPFRK